MNRQPEIPAGSNPPPGSAEWQQQRSRYGNASEAAALLDCSPWFPRTPFELWLFKTGRATVALSPAMARGLALEPLARAYLEQAYNEVFEPQVMIRKRLSASLDGLTFDGQRVLEIKCPNSGRRSMTWSYVAEHGKPPEHYWWQVQQQLYCSGSRSCLFAVCHGQGERIEGHIACEVQPDPQAFELLATAWAEFFTWLDQDLPPLQTERDWIERGDVLWQRAATDWKAAKQDLDRARSREARARKRLIAAAAECSSFGAGVKLTRYWKRGEIDWAAATQGMDVEPFRKQGAWYYRISELSEQET